MKRIYRYMTTLAPALLAFGLLASLSGCRKAEVDPAPVEGPYQIAFDQVATKGLITDDNLTSFKVWGETVEGTADIFDGVQVDKGTAQDENGNEVIIWSYTGDKYWEDNKTYNFFAVAPTSFSLSYDQNAGYYIEYQAVDDMTADMLDMVIAKETRQITNLDSKPDDVHLQFSHTLSKINLQLAKSVDNEDQVINVSDIYLYGMKGSGEYFFNSGWVLGTEAASVNRTDISIPLSTNYTSFGEFLTIPQTLSENSIYLIVTFEYTSNSITTSRVQIAPVPVGVVSEWEAGKSYTYKAEISVDHEIVFASPSVEKWISGNEGGTIIIK